MSMHCVCVEARIMIKICQLSALLALSTKTSFIIERGHGGDPDRTTFIATIIQIVFLLEYICNNNVTLIYVQSYT